jgi:hypothetical protein
MRVAYLLTFGGGAILGMAATFLLIPSVDPVEPVSLAGSPPGDQTGEIRRLRTLLDEKDSNLAEVKTELVNLRSELDQARRAQAAAQDLLAENDPEAEELRRQQRREEARAEGIRRFIDRRTDDLRQRFDLTEAQIAEARAYYEARSEFRAAQITARRNGEELPVWNGPSTSEAMAQVLDPEQFAAYEAYSEAVQTSRSETRATARMNAFAPELGLDEAQKDAVYAVYYEDSWTTFSEDADIAPEQREAALIANMQSILSPEQFARWQQIELEIQSRRERRGGGG